MLNYSSPQLQLLLRQQRAKCCCDTVSRVLWLGSSVLGSAGMWLSFKEYDPCYLLCFRKSLYGLAGYWLCKPVGCALTGLLVFLFSWFLGLNLPMLPRHRAQFCSLAAQRVSEGSHVDPCVPFASPEEVALPLLLDQAELFCASPETTSCLARGARLGHPSARAMPRQGYGRGSRGSRSAWAGWTERPGGCRACLTEPDPAPAPVFALPGCVRVLHGRAAVGLFLLLGSSGVGRCPRASQPGARGACMGLPAVHLQRCCWSSKLSRYELSPRLGPRVRGAGTAGVNHCSASVAPVELAVGKRELL